MKNIFLLVLTLTILLSGVGFIAISVFYLDDFLVEMQDSSLNENVLGQSEQVFKVTKVVDGDTIKVEIEGKIETIRLIGIDTPEVDSGLTKQECFGQEASKKTKELLESKYVRLESDSTQTDRDKYGRLLRYVYLAEDTKSINQILIEEGYAFEYTYKIPYKFQTKFKILEDFASENKLGLWGDACQN